MKKHHTDLVGDAVDLILSTASLDADGFPTRPGRTVAVQGPHGIGKTSAAKAAAKARGLGAVYLSAPVVDVSSLYCSFPTRDAEVQVVTILHRLFHQEQPWMLIIDDFRRVTPSAQGALFELMNEGSLAGHRLTGHVGTLLLDNPAGAGYQGIGGGDPAFETRFRTIEVDANSTPWRTALRDKYEGQELSALFEAWSRWDPEVRRVVCPRVLDHLVGVAQEGLPLEVGLPILPSGRQKVLDSAGEDRTETVLGQVAEALGVSVAGESGSLVPRAINAAVRNGWNVHLVGPHGIGKTAFVRSALDAAGIDGAYLSMAHQTPADLLVTVPTDDGKISIVPNAGLMARDGAPKMIVADEVFRAPGNIRGQMLEMFQERSLGGVPLGVRGVIALNNPAKWGEFTYPVGKADSALCSRFEVNLEVTEDMIPWKDYLQGIHGAETVRPFLEWRAHSLSDVERAIVCPRVVEGLVDIWKFNQTSNASIPLESALPMGADGKRVPIRLHDLHRLLDGLEVLGFAKIVGDSDRVLEGLRTQPADEAGESAQRTLEVEVVRALQNAELFELEEQPELCRDLISALTPSSRIAVFRAAKSSGDSAPRQLFWAKIAKELVGKND